MKKSLFSAHWYRVAAIKPRLKSHAGIHRHHYRGQTWYVLSDELAGRYHRFTESAYALINLMDGERTLQTIWELAVGQSGEDAPSQDELIQLLGQLHGADLLGSDVAPDLAELFGRRSLQRNQQWKQRFMSPMAMRVGLFDPDRLLNRWVGWVRPVFTPAGACLWAALFVSALVTGVSHWKALTQNMSDTVLTPQNLLIMALLFPLIKALHELGHACAVKVWGGEVHEIGIMLLVFMPVPYVDASASAMFRERYKRVVVGAAGVMAELFVASLAMLYWANAEPGLGKTIAYNIVFIAGVSAVIFNINPLLRFDGYYVFSDLLEIPNLGQRATRYMTYVFQSRVLRLDGLSSPVTAPGERFWFVFYGIASFVYRCLIAITIALFVASKLFVVGVALALVSLTSMFIVPLCKGAWFLLTNSRLQAKRKRVLGLCAVFLTALLALVFAVPLSSWTNAEGVVWLPEKALVRSGTDCFVTRLLVKPGQRVSADQALIACEDPLIIANLEKAKSELNEATVRYVDALEKDPASASVIQEDIQSLEANWRDLQDRQAKLVMRSNANGRFEVPTPQDLVGQYVDKGKVLAYVLGDEPVKVRLAVPQDQAAQVRNDSASVEMVRASQMDQVIHAKLSRELPGADNLLPSVALGNAGGGNIAVDPRDPKGLKTFYKVFQFDVDLPASSHAQIFGERVHVRVHHRDEVLAARWYRSVRRLLLEKFGV